MTSKIKRCEVCDRIHLGEERLACATIQSMRETQAVLVAALEEMLEAIPDLTNDTDPRSWPDVRKAEARVRGILNAAMARAAEETRR